MDEKYIFLKPTFSTAIWGDGSLVRHYNVEKYVPKDMNIDEITGLGAFCGLPQDANEIMNGKYKGRKLNELYDEHPEMFGTPSTLKWEHIPVSMGIAYACADLSIQVHPTEDYALKNLGCHGKVKVGILLTVHKKRILSWDITQRLFSNWMNIFKIKIGMDY